MNQKEFEKLFEKIFDQTRDVLIAKAAEYATDDDRLHNFRAGAGLTGETPEQVCWGFAVKHLVSISDMVAADERFAPSKFDMEKWDEKIGDALNYLILLRALIEEGASFHDSTETERS